MHPKKILAKKIDINFVLCKYRFTEDILDSRIFVLTFRSKGLIGIFLYLTALNLYSLKFRVWNTRLNLCTHALQSVYFYFAKLSKIYLTRTVLFNPKQAGWAFGAPPPLFFCPSTLIFWKIGLWTCILTQYLFCKAFF